MLIGININIPSILFLLCIIPFQIVLSLIFCPDRYFNFRDFRWTLQICYFYSDDPSFYICICFNLTSNALYINRCLFQELSRAISIHICMNVIYSRFLMFRNIYNCFICVWCYFISRVPNNIILSIYISPHRKLNGSILFRMF